MRHVAWRYQSPPTRRLWNFLPLLYSFTAPAIAPANQQLKNRATRKPPGQCDIIILLYGAIDMIHFTHWFSSAPHDISAPRISLESRLSRPFSLSVIPSCPDWAESDSVGSCTGRSHRSRFPSPSRSRARTPPKQYHAPAREALRIGTTLLCPRCPSEIVSRSTPHSLKWHE